jgi:pimeloyl-ACP methyl ester carboxylesterase
LRTRPSVLSILGAMIAVAIMAPIAHPQPVPKPTGKLVDLGGHRLHVHCTGHGRPTVMIESGLGDFSFDWALVQDPVSRFTRICTYDRAGYAWSDPGPTPRTFDQLNLELHDALVKLGERGPYVLVDHSYGGPVVRNYALAYPQEVAGMVQVDAAFEGECIPIGGGKTMRLGDEATGRRIPPPHETPAGSDKPAILSEDLPPELKSLEPAYRVLPLDDQNLHLWAQQLPAVYNAEVSQREWSAEYFAQWLKTSQEGTLGSIPLIVLTRAEGGYGNDMDVPAAEMEKARKEGQASLRLLSSDHKQVFVHSGHNMHLEAPTEVTEAVREVVHAVRKNSNLQ